MAQIEILMSTYNGEKYLPEQIDSLINQSYTDWHLTVRDDNSSDNTLKILRRYCSLYPERVSIMPSDRNVRSKQSFEILLANANANYYMFCDQDDVWERDKIMTALSAIKDAECKYGSIPIIVCSDLKLVDENLEPMGNTLWGAAKINVNILQTPEYLSVNNYIAGCTMLFNNKAKELSLPFGKNAIMHDAWISLVTIANSGRIVILPESHILYRQHGGNVVGASEIKTGLKYFVNKIVGIKSVIKNNYANYKQSNEVLNISLPSFIIKRVIYLVKR